MFGEVGKELCRAKKRIQGKSLLVVSPAYIVHITEESNTYISDSLENLIKLLEENDLLSPEKDGGLYLFLERGFLKDSGRETVGLSDETGRFFTSLEQWIYYLNIEHQIQQGIVIVRIEWTKELQEENVWWRRFFRQMCHYKEDFLFIIFAGGKRCC